MIICSVRGKIVSEKEKIAKQTWPKTPLPQSQGRCSLGTFFVTLTPRDFAITKIAIKLNVFLHSIHSATETPFLLQNLKIILTQACAIEKTFMNTIAFTRLSYFYGEGSMFVSIGFVMLISISY